MQVTQKLSLPAAAATPQITVNGGHAPKVAQLAKSRPVEAIALDRADLAHQVANSPAVTYASRPGAPLNVGIVSLAGMGGSGKVARDCAKAYADAGHHVTLFTRDDAFYGDHDLGNLKTHVVSSLPATPREPNQAWTTQLGTHLASVVTSKDIDVLHVHYVAGLLAASLHAKDVVEAHGRKCSVVATLHGTDVSTWGADFKHRADIAAQLSRCDGVSAVSQWMADEASRIFNLETRPSVVANSIDTQVFNPSSWSNLRQRIAPNGEFILCHASNLRDVKRPLDTVEILARVRHAGLDAKLLLVGDGPLIDPLYARATELGVADYIHWVGSQEPHRVAKYIAASDLSLVTSASESFSLSALESMACGVPVVGTHCGGLDEVAGHIDRGVNGISRLLSPVGDVDAMAETCIALLTNEKRYKRVQRQCVPTALERFPPSTQARGYLQLLDDSRPVSASAAPREDGPADADAARH